MTLKTGLATALVAAVVAALVTAATRRRHLAHGAGSGRCSPAALDEKKIIDIVHDYLTKNPEILVEMTNELDKRQQADQAAKQQKVISDNADAMFRSPLAFVAGNPNGDVSVVEFFDYNCGFCRRALPDVVKLVDSDDKVRVVLKELPIFGDDPEAAAKGALAAGKQGKYFEMHQKLFAEPGKADKDKAMRIAGRAWPRRAAARKGHGGSLRPAGARRGQGPGAEARAARHAALSDRRPRRRRARLTISTTNSTANVAEMREKGCKATC